MQDNDETLLASSRHRHSHVLDDTYGHDVDAGYFNATSGQQLLPRM